MLTRPAKVYFFSLRDLGMISNIHNFPQKNTMDKYEHGKIYKIISANTQYVYIGSTCQPLSQRMSGHRASYRQHFDGSGRYLSSFEILKYPDAKIILIENFPCKSRDELRAREQFYVEKNRENVVNVSNVVGNNSRLCGFMWARNMSEDCYLKCECGDQVSKGHLKKHVKTERHRQLLSKNDESRPHQHVEDYYQKCECGELITKSNLKRHMKSNKHKQLLSKEQTV